MWNRGASASALPSSTYLTQSIKLWPHLTKCAARLSDQSKAEVTGRKSDLKLLKQRNLTQLAVLLEPQATKFFTTETAQWACDLHQVKNSMYIVYCNDIKPSSDARGERDLVIGISSPRTNGMEWWWSPVLATAQSRQRLYTRSLIAFQMTSLLVFQMKRTCCATFLTFTATAAPLGRRRSGVGQWGSGR